MFGHSSWLQGASHGDFSNGPNTVPVHRLGKLDHRTLIDLEIVQRIPTESIYDFTIGKPA